MAMPLRCFWQTIAETRPGQRRLLISGKLPDRRTYYASTSLARALVATNNIEQQLRGCACPARGSANKRSWVPCPALLVRKTLKQ